MDHGPTPEQPLMVGLLVDVSGSMLSSMNNRAGDTRSRLEAFRDSLEDLVDRARDLSLAEDGERVAPLISLFAYGFGFGNPLSFLFGGRGPAVRDLLALPRFPASLVPIDQLAQHWKAYKQNLESLARSMAGQTPMLEGFQTVHSRIAAELENRRYTGAPTLFVLSDGEPTDADPQSIQKVASAIRATGVTIVSCYVTDQDIAKPRYLYGAPGPNWPAGAKLMFECASPIEVPSPFHRYLLEYDWNLEAQARLYANQSIRCSLGISKRRSQSSSRR